MKLLLDQNLSHALCRPLELLFPGTAHVRQIGLADANDRDVWAYALHGGFAIVSRDSDFADMAALSGPPPKLIWLRCGNRTTPLIEALLLERAARILTFDDDDDAACLEIG